MTIRHDNSSLSSHSCLFRYLRFVHTGRVAVHGAVAVRCVAFTQRDASGVNEPLALP